MGPSHSKLGGMHIGLGTSFVVVFVTNDFGIVVVVDSF